MFTKTFYHSVAFCAAMIMFLFCNADAQAQTYISLTQKAILVDTHNDLLSQCTEHGYSFDQDLKGKTHSDLQRFKEGGVDAQFFSVFCDGLKKDPFLFANRQIDTLYATIARNPNKISLVRTPAELLQAVHDQKLAALIGVEGGHMIENDRSKLDSLFKRGVRYMTLTWNNSTPWATSAFEENHDSLLHQPKGLNEFGKQIVRHMNELGMMVDISHVGEHTFWDVINTTTKPVIASHSSVYSLCPVPRNLKDEQIKAIAKNGGVIQLNFYSGFLDSNYSKHNAAFEANHKAERDSLVKAHEGSQFFANEYLFTKYHDEVVNLRAPLSLLIAHLEYIVHLVGVDHVGLGSDFDGIESPPQQLDDVTTYPLITKALLERGYSKKDIIKILGGNLIRVFKSNTKN